MKKTFLFFLALVASVGTMKADDIEKVWMNDVYYNINKTTQTAEATYQELWSENNYAGLTTVYVVSSFVYDGVNYRVTSIGNNAFYHCTSLVDVHIGTANIASIGENAFTGCTSLTSINIPNTVTKISYGTFYGCSSLEAITLPSSITEIDSWAFASTSLKEINIPYGVTKIGSCAFSKCTALTKVSFPETITEVLSGAFSDCTGLTEPIYNSHVFAYLPTSHVGVYEVPAGIEKIASEAFWGCSGLTAITLPNTITSIDFATFVDCTSLETIDIPEGVTTLGVSAFNGCTSLTSVTFPSTLTEIKDGAFYKCSSLVNVTLPNTVTTMGHTIFTHCDALTAPIYNDKIFACLPVSYSGEYTVPDGIEHIIGNAFNGCASLTAVTIPNSVTGIERETFSMCTGLKSVNLPNTITTIEYQAFFDCTGLNTITLPSSVEYLGNGALWGCKSLTSIICEATTPPGCGSGVFDGSEIYPGLDFTTCKLYVPDESVEAYKTANQWEQFGDNIMKLSMSSTEEVESQKANGESRKVFRNGQFYILRDGKTYDAQGAEVR